MTYYLNLWVISAPCCDSRHHLTPIWGVCYPCLGGTSHDHNHNQGETMHRMNTFRKAYRELWAEAYT
jgi:hypothetical protein